MPWIQAKAFRDRKVLITGAGRGIGERMARDFCLAGAHVFVNDRNVERAQAVVQQLQSQQLRATTAIADITCVAEVERMFNAIGDGSDAGVDIFINSAGYAQRLPLWEVDEAYWDQVLNVNLKGPFFCLQAAARQMKEKGWGRIVLLGSVGGFAAQRNLAAYGAAKAGLILLAKSTAVELAPLGVTVNVVSPGAVEGPWNDQFFSNEEYKQRWERTVPMGRMATNEDVSQAVMYFASAEAAYVTGQVMYVDGGKLAYVPSVDPPTGS